MDAILPFIAASVLGGIAAWAFAELLLRLSRRF